MRVLALLTIGVLAAAAEPPRGKRTARPKPTHLVVAPAVLDAGGGVKAQLSPGVPVAAGLSVPARGKVKVTVVGAVLVQGTIDAAALGKRIAAETELRSLDGKTKLGTARAGAPVRLTGKRVPAGMVAVQTIGQVVADGAVAGNAVVVEGPAPIVAEEWGMQTVKPADLFAGPEVKGVPIARLEKDTRLVLVEQRGEVARVRTHGAIALEGWTLNANLESRDSSVGEKPAERKKPTHEVFVDAPLYAGAAGAKTIASIRGGTLVQAEKRLAGDPAPRVKLKTLGGTEIEGYMKLTDLRPLEDSVWSEPTR